MPPEEKRQAPASPGLPGGRTDPPQAIKDLVEGVGGENVPVIYANGFTIFRGNSDTGIVFQLQNRPNMVVHLSYTLAKTLAEKMGSMITELEESTGRSIMTTSFIEASIVNE